LSIAFIFPGQGSQSVGMGAELAGASAAARHVFEEVDEALGQKLSALMRDGPASELELTANAQPAIMANAMATFRAAGVDVTRAAFVAGHSLGEYTALASANALGLADTARLLRIRGTAMQDAVPVGEGAMAALIGAEWAQAEEIARDAAEGDVCQAANDNAPGQVVISGHKAAVERAMALAKERGIRRALLLPVSAPFHCSLMQPAADRMREALAGAELKTPAVPVFANVTAAPTRQPEDIRALLVAQITGAVRWRESVLGMVEAGVTHFVEWGGKVLGPMVGRIAADARATSVVTMADIEKVAGEL